MASLAEIRQKYPQYDDLTDEALADALYNKSYSDMPRADFDAKIGLASSVPSTPMPEGQWVTPGPEPGDINIPIISDLTRSLYPFERNTETGEMRAAVPKIIPALFNGTVDAVMLPGDVTAGKVDPLSAEGVDRSINFAGAFGSGGLKNGVMPTIPRASRNVARAMKDDGLTAGQVSARLDELGDGAMLMDLGPNLQRQAGAIAALPGPGAKTIRTAIAERAALAPERVADDVAQTVGSGPDLATLVDNITAAQSRAAGPLYDVVRDVQIKVPPALEFISRSPLGQQALRQARRLAANDGYVAEGTTVGLVDYMKRALDDVATSANRSGNKNVARQATNMAKAITAAVDAQVPGYKTARDAFAGPARVLDAVESGQAVFSKDVSPSQLRSEFDKLSPSEKDGYLAGVQGSIEAVLGNAVNEPLALRNTFKKGWNEAKLRYLLGNAVADDLMRRIEREVTYGKTGNVVAGNSETAARNAAMPEVSPKDGSIGQMTILGAALLALEKARAKYRGVVQPKVNNEMAERLSMDLPSADPTFISEVERAMNPQPFLPSAMRDLTRAAVVEQQPPPYFDQLSALGILRGPHT